MAAVLDCYADDVDYESWPATGLSINYAQAAGVPWLQRRQGKAAVAQHLGAVGELEITDFAILGFLSGDNTVIVQVVIQAKWTPTGFTFHDEELQYFQFQRCGQNHQRLDTISTLRSTWLQLDSASPVSERRSAAKVTNDRGTWRRVPGEEPGRYSTKEMSWMIA